ncbi:MAG: RsmD family RNA methyltransferase [Chloroflexota bacterium]|nr:RsmD family RNA methyltransferase [Chloroflexota bacterium]
MARVEQVMRRPPDGPPYDVLFADPPYAVPDDELRGVLRAARASGWLAPDAVVAVERPSRGAPWRWPHGLTAERFRRYGEATLWYGRAAGPSPAADPAGADDVDLGKE